MESNILLESGTNELEVLEFTVGDQSFGINIAKVTEIMNYQPVTPVPDAPPEFEGVFTPRDTVISVVDLHKVLKKESNDIEHDLLVVCHFNQMDVGFHVTSVKGIQRISWEDIEKPPAISGDGMNNIATGIAKLKDHIILILDFEKIVSDLNRSAVLDKTGITQGTGDLDSKHIVVAEDSPFLNTLIVGALNEAGYKNVVHFDNGKDAWDYISGHKELGGTMTDHISCLISDIEMPQMDGHHLTKLIKEDSELRCIPVFLFSSLINDQMRKKGEAVGADAQFSKPQIGALIKYINENV